MQKPILNSYSALQKLGRYSIPREGLSRLASAISMALIVSPTLFLYMYTVFYNFLS